MLVYDRRLYLPYLRIKADLEHPAQRN